MAANMKLVFAQAINFTTVSANICYALSEASGVFLSKKISDETPQGLALVPYQQFTI